MKYIINNILTNKERRKLIRDANDDLLDWNMINGATKKYFYPGKQTAPTDYNENIAKKYNWAHIIFKDRIDNYMNWDCNIIKSWINWTNGNKKDINWHSHYDSPYSAVYYMRTLPFFSDGTLFRDGFVKVPQNSLLIFPSHLEHTAPTSVIPFSRYTMAFEVKINKFIGSKYG
jgi:hypothetical protein